MVLNKKGLEFRFCNGPEFEIFGMVQNIEIMEWSRMLQIWNGPDCNTSRKIKKKLFLKGPESKLLEWLKSDIS